MITKRLAELIKVLYKGILADAACTFPNEALSFERDLSRIETIVDQREIGFFTLFLPTFDKHLTRCLDEERFVSFPGPNMATARGVVYPRLFSGLTKQIFREDGTLHEVNDDRTSFALMALQTCLSGCKKLRLECTDEAVNSTVQSFIATEEVVRPYSLNWGDDILRCHRGLSIVGDEASACGVETRNLFREPMALCSELLSSYRTVQHVADRVFSGFGSPFDTDLRPRHGPGAIADRRDNPSKFQFSNWPAKLEQCFPSDLFGQPNGKLGVRAALDESAPSFFEEELPSHRDSTRFRDVAVASKLVAVPKTQKGPRLIAAEPASNMWMQQSLLGFLTDAVASSPLSKCIDFKDQSHSGKLALEASLTKSHSTIDLSDASDRLSCWLVERLFRSNYDLLQAFNAVRTDVVSIPTEEFGTDFPKLTRLKKFSTQGSALTFPVQTIVYAVICIGVLIDKSGKDVTTATINWAAKQVRLYGDDIIVPTEITESVVECLEALGFKVNSGKTFQKGNFRESCGVDGYMGVDVTPAYVLEPFDETSPGSIVSLVECSNNFYMKGLWHAAEALKSTISDGILSEIPVVRVKQGLSGKWYRAGSFGFLSMMGFSYNDCKYRWSEKFQNLEIKLSQPKSTVDKSELGGDYALLQYFTEVPSLTEPEKASWTGLSEPRFDPWSSGEARRPKLAMKRRWVPAETLDVVVPTP